jgi:DNA invertase Pin-like site-specific DNA recombinase
MLENSQLSAELPPEKPQRRKAVSYLRFSTPAQSEGDSEDRQKELAALYCEQNDLELINVFFDRGKSARKGMHRKKGEFGDFLRAVEKGTIPSETILLVESFDRLSREQVTTALKQFLDLIETHKIEVHILQAGRAPAVYRKDSVDSHSLMFAIIEMGRAFGESDRKSQLIGSAWQAQRNRGVPIGLKGGRPMGRHPSWLIWEQGKWIVIPERVAVIRQVFDMCLKQRLGRYEIAVRLCRDKVHYWSNKGEHWTSSGVKRVLSNPALTGRLDPQKSKHPDAEAIEDYYPRIISDEEYLEVQRILSARQSNGGRPRKVHPESLLTGMTYAKGARVHRGYATMRSGNHQLTYAYLYKERNCYLATGKSLDHLVLSAMGQMVDSDLCVTDAEIKRRKLFSGIAEMRNLHREAEAKINRLVDVLAGGPDGKDFDIPKIRGALMSAQMDRDNYMKKIIGLEAEIERLPSDGVDTHKELMALVERAEGLDAEARSEVRSLLSRLIARIDVIRNDWPEWAERDTGAIDELAPEWAVRLLDKSYRIFSVDGQLEPYMLALELRNGRKLGVIASKHTVMLLRPKE